MRKPHAEDAGIAEKADTVSPSAKPNSQSSVSPVENPDLLKRRAPIVRIGNKDPSA